MFSYKWLRYACRMISCLCFFLDVCIARVNAQTFFSPVMSRERGNISTRADTAAVHAILKNAGLLLSSRMDSSRILYESALRKSLKAGYDYGTAHALIGIAISHIEKGAHTTAEQVLNNALGYCMRAEIRRDYILGVWYDTKGTNARNLAYSDSSIYYYEKALEHADRIKDRRLLITISTNLGVLYTEGHDSSATYSAMYLKQAAALASDSFRVKLPIIYANLAKVYEITRRDSLLLHYVKLALLTAEEFRDVRAERMSYNILGDYYLHKKKTDSAIAVFRKGLLLKEAHSPFSQFTFLYGLSACYYEGKLMDSALYYGNQALLILEQTQRNSGNTNAFYKFFAEVQAAAGNYDMAYKLMGRYAGLNDILNNAERQKQLDHYNIRYETAQKDLSIARQKDSIKEKNIWIYIIVLFSILCIILLVLFNVISRNKQKIKAIQLKELEQQYELAHLQAQRQGEEQERHRISKELHDGIASVLAAAKMKLMNIGDKGLTELSASGVYQSGLELVQQAYDDVRYTAHNLSSEKLKKKSLIENLEQHCLQVSTPNRLMVNYHHFGRLPSLDNDFVIDIFRVIQELLHNIIKYAEAGEVNVQTGCSMEEFNISIEDNGNGSDIKATPHAGLGWHHLSTRIKAWNGSYEIDSRKDIGTTIYINFKLPISKNSFRSGL